MSGPRERYRSQVRDEVKAVALDQLAAGGPQAVSVNAIGKALGVSGPALYRYFANRDALLAALVVDAYAELTTAVAGSPDLATWTARFRAWARAQPHRYRLLFAAPAPGAGGSEPAAAVVEAAQTLMESLAGVLPVQGAPEPAAPLRAQLEAWARTRGSDLAPAAGLLAIGVWARVHGFIALELEGNFAAMGLDGDRLFAALLAELTA